MVGKERESPVVGPGSSPAVKAVSVRRAAHCSVAGKNVGRWVGIWEGNRATTWWLT